MPHRAVSQSLRCFTLAPFLFRTTASVKIIFSRTSFKHVVAYFAPLMSMFQDFPGFRYQFNLQLVRTSIIVYIFFYRCNFAIYILSSLQQFGKGIIKGIVPQFSFYNAFILLFVLIRLMMMIWLIMLFMIL